MLEFSSTVLPVPSPYLVFHNRHEPKIGAAVPPFCGGGAGFPPNTMSLGPRPTSLQSGILIHPAIWPRQIKDEKWGSVHLWEGELGRYLTQCGQGQGLPACQVSLWSKQPFGHNTPTSQTGQDRTGHTDRQTHRQTDSCPKIIAYPSSGRKWLLNLQ